VWKLIRYFREELLIIFGTSTSDPVLPRLLLKLERLGCDKAIVGLVLPMSYSFNLTGIAIFLTVASMFIAQACNVHLSAGQIATMLVVMLLTSKGATGVAGSGFVVLVATLSVIPDIPIAGVALIVGVDRFMSEMRAITSTLGNAVATIVIAKWEHACDHATLTRELDEGYVEVSDGSP
jgi:aerobic C4-dicarboxylate transport protein